MGHKFDKRQNYGMYDVEAVIRGDGPVEGIFMILALVIIFGGWLGFF